MAVRAAKFGDIPRLYELMEEMYSKSVYVGRDEIDTKHAKALLVNAIQRHGGKYEGSALVMVSETNGKVQGFIIGYLDRIYLIGRKLRATDMFFYQSEQASPKDAFALVRSVIEWAASNDQVIEIDMAATNAVGDHRRTGKLLQRFGLIECGTIYKRSIDKCPVS